MPLAPRLRLELGEARAVERMRGVVIGAAAHQSERERGEDEQPLHATAPLLVVSTIGIPRW